MMSDSETSGMICFFTIQVDEDGQWISVLCCSDRRRCYAYIAKDRKKQHRYRIRRIYFSPQKGFEVLELRMTDMISTSPY